MRMFSFPKTQRILNRLDFTAVLDDGAKVVNSLMVITAKANDRSEARLGCIVSKKIGNAVIRNLIKRRLREAFRRMRPHVFPNVGIDLVVIARLPIVQADFSEVCTQLQRSALQAIQRSGMRIPGHVRHDGSNTVILKAVEAAP